MRWDTFTKRAGAGTIPSAPCFANNLAGRVLNFSMRVSLPLSLCCIQVAKLIPYQPVSADVFECCSAMLSTSVYWNWLLHEAVQTASWLWLADLFLSKRGSYFEARKIMRQDNQPMALTRELSVSAVSAWTTAKHVKAATYWTAHCYTTIAHCDWTQPKDPKVHFSLRIFGCRKNVVFSCTWSFACCCLRSPSSVLPCFRESLGSLDLSRTDTLKAPEPLVVA